MKIIIVGASGAVGNAALQALRDRHEIITVGKTSGDIQANIEDVDRIREMYEKVGKVDAMVCAVGHGYFGAVDNMTSEQFMLGINHKLMPQVNLVFRGLNILTMVVLLR